jgi:hypothetical protein
LHRAENVAGHIESLGYRAKAVPSNNSYRRSPDAFATHPSFSHRFGAIASGIAAQGWSGNVMTEEYGAAMYLGTVVTEAALKSDTPRYSPRHFIDGYCSKCRLCEITCVAARAAASAAEEGCTFGLFRSDASAYKPQVRLDRLLAVRAYFAYETLCDNGFERGGNKERLNVQFNEPGYRGRRVLV